MRTARLLPTRVYRFYRGGALLARLRSVEEEDGPFPEDRVGSVTPALNPGRDEPEAGLSRLADGRLLRNAIAADPEGWLGRAHLEQFGETTGLLVKLLDSAERLPVHAHPNREFARENLGSQFGKTEAWIVLATRAAEGELGVGLRDQVAPETYRDWIEHQDTQSLLLSLNSLSVRQGEVVFVPAGVPHAIGAGVLIAELQEPTDFSLLCEWEGFPVRPEDSHLGLGLDRAIEALDLNRHEPVLGLPDEAREFFWADDAAEPAGRFAVLVVTEGEGSLGCEPARAGDAFAVPAAAEPFEARGDLRILRCLGPELSTCA
jgi:mannose-6-phosphate isomerase